MSRFRLVWRREMPGFSRKRPLLEAQAFDSIASVQKNDRCASPHAMNYFYLDEQNREIGPVTIENLKAFRSADVIKDHTLVRSDTGGPWTACVAIVGTVSTTASSAAKSSAEKVVSEAVADARAALTFLLTNPVGGLGKR